VFSSVGKGPLQQINRRPKSTNTFVPLSNCYITIRVRVRMRVCIANYAFYTALGRYALL